MKIQCMACTPPTNWETDVEYKDHLVTFHGTDSADEAMRLEMAKRANTPVNLPPGVPPEAAPSTDFIKTMTEIEKAKATSTVTPPPVPAPVTPPKIDPVILKYDVSGIDENGHQVTALEMDIDKVHFVVAYCLQEKKQIKVWKVPKLENENKNEVSDMSEGNIDNAISSKDRKSEILLKKVHGFGKKGKTILEQGKTSIRRDQKKIKHSKNG